MVELGKEGHLNWKEQDIWKGHFGSEKEVDFEGKTKN